jgi:hypothetical protein
VAFAIGGVFSRNAHAFRYEERCTMARRRVCSLRGYERQRVLPETELRWALPAWTETDVGSGSREAFVPIPKSQPDGTGGTALIVAGR